MNKTINNPLVAVEIDGVTKNMPMIEVAETNTANSLVVAQYFGRRHTLVISDVEELIGNESPIVAEFAAKHFLKDTYMGANGQARPMYHMTQSGFAKLVSRWNGREAEEFMVRYIERFDDLQLENTRLLEQQIERQREDYRLLKGELGGDVVEYYTNKLSDTEFDLRQARAERDNFLNKLAATKPPTKDERREVAMKAADKALKTRNAGIVKAVSKILKETKTIRARLRVFECAGDFVLANGLDGVEDMVRGLAYMTDEDLVS